MLERQSKSQTAQDLPLVQRQKHNSPYKTKEGSKPPIQAKQRLVQRQVNLHEAAVKANVTKLMGVDVSDAQVTYGSAKPATMGADAVAQGKNIDIAPNKESTLGHELVHRAQVKKGVVQATGKLGDGTPINTDLGLEKQADVIGDKAQQMVGAGNQADIGQMKISAGSSSVGSGIVQRKLNKNLSDEEARALAENQFDHLRNTNFGYKERVKDLGSQYSPFDSNINNARQSFVRALLMTEHASSDAHDVDAIDWTQKFVNICSREGVIEGNEFTAYEGGNDLQGIVRSDKWNQLWTETKGNALNNAGHQWGPATGPLGQWAQLGHHFLEIGIAIYNIAKAHFNDSEEEGYTLEQLVNIAIHVVDGASNLIKGALGTGAGTTSEDWDHSAAPIHALIGERMQNYCKDKLGMNATERFFGGVGLEIVCSVLADVVKFYLTKSLKGKEIKYKRPESQVRGMRHADLHRVDRNSPS